MFPHRLTDRSAFDIAQALIDGFNRHYRLFRETTAAAKQRFERAAGGHQPADREHSGDLGSGFERFQPRRHRLASSRRRPG